MRKIGLISEEGKQVGYFCGYFREGVRLQDDEGLFYFVKSKEFATLKNGEQISLFKKVQILDDNELIQTIKQAVETKIPVTKRKNNKFFSREEIRTSYTDLTDTSLPISLQLEDLVNKLTKIQNERVVMPVLVSSLMIPSALVMNFVIIVFYGASGTGKSALIRLASEMYDIPVVNTTATYAGIRNHIQNLRYRTDENGDLVETNMLVTIDDINSDTLKDPKLFGLLKTGASLSTAGTIISSQSGGKNSDFNGACPKALSTCEPFWRRPEYHELRRRIVLIPTQQSEEEFIDKEEINFKPS